MTDDELDALGPFLDLSDDEIAELVLMLMLEKAAKEKLAKYRAKLKSEDAPEKSEGAIDVGWDCA